jgi:hypothetical protein
MARGQVDWRVEVCAGVRDRAEQKGVSLQEVFALVDSSKAGRLKPA